MFIPQSHEDLERIVAERLKETAQLEFKRQLPNSGKNEDLARDLCAMANAQGGVIIYGIEEDNLRRAVALVPFSLAGIAERISLVARSSIDEPIELTDIKPFEQQDQQGFLVVVVPKSERAPHFCRGTAWGRTLVGNTVLIRRQIGELFARSPGFSEEFGLMPRRPGRIRVTHISEPSHVSVRGSSSPDYFLLFENDGDSAVVEANWEWVRMNEGKEPPTVHVDLFPVERFPSGHQIRVRVLHTFATSIDNVRVRTFWKDEDGKEHEELWPIGW